jgi:4-amino-4-deoxy-L-arabinose transferase-like glycosyltransferase
MNTVSHTHSISTWSTAAWVGVLCLATLLRLVALDRFRADLDADPDDYFSIAQSVAAGQGYLKQTANGPQPTAYRPPVYPLMLAAILRLGGDRFAIGLVQVCLGVMTVAITIAAARRLGLKWSAYVAGLFVAVDPLLVRNTTLVMTETLATCLTVAWLVTLPKSNPDAAVNGSPEKWGYIRAIPCGLLFGTAALCRPVYWAVLPFLAVVWGTRFAKRSELGPLAACCVSAILVVSAWGVRNQFVFGRPILTTTHGGYTLLLAHNDEYVRRVVNNADSNGMWPKEPLLAWQRSLEDRLAGETPPLDERVWSPGVELARDQWMSRQARSFLFANPAQSVRISLSLLSRFWGWLPRSESGLLSYAAGVHAALLIIAACIGSLVVSGGRDRSWLTLLSVIVAFTLVHSQYWADMRMRAPLEPLLALLAARGCRALCGFAGLETPTSALIGANR